MSNNQWILPCSPSTYDCWNAFNTLIAIDWHQTKQITNIEIDDIVYMYTSAPIKSITHQCIVNKIKIPDQEIPDYDFYVDKSKYTQQGPFIELQCLREFDDIDGLKLEALRKNGIKGNIQSALKLNENLKNHLVEMVNKQNVFDRFSGSNMQYVGAYMDRNAGSSYIHSPMAQNLSDKSLKLFSENKQKTLPTVNTVTTTRYNRNPFIAEYAKRQANGICQLCKKPAPFADKDGNPYLESHHIIWLSNNGVDSIDNTVALCPNCHRKMHIVNDPKDVAYLQQIKSKG